MLRVDEADRQRCWEDVTVGEHLDSEHFPLSLYRLVMAAGGNRDFNSIHHNPAYAAASGAPTAYANVFAVVTPIRKPVNDPGPAVTATSSIDCGDQPASRNNRHSSGASD